MEAASAAEREPFSAGGSSSASEREDRPRGRAQLAIVAGGELTGAAADAREPLGVGARAVLERVEERQLRAPGRGERGIFVT